jgi:MFS family permease
MKYRFRSGRREDCVVKIFSNKNFTWMLLGRIITNIGDSLYAVAAMWLVYDLGGSTFYTGLAGFLTIFPRIIQFFSGPLIDRFPVRPILIYTQLIQCVLLLIIPIAYYFGFLHVSLVLIITPIVTTFNMFVYPAQMASLPKFVDEKDLTKANSLFAIAYQGIEIMCNAIAGILIVLIGAVSVYLLDSVMFLIGAYIFSMIRMPNQSSKENEVNTKKPEVNNIQRDLKTYMRTYMKDLKDGTKMLLGSTFTRLLVGVIAINLVGGATFVVLPEFSDSKGGATVYGFLLMAQAVGSLSGALLAPYLRLEKFGVGRVYSIAFLISGIAWSLSVFSPWTWMMIMIYGLAWFPGGVTNILIQTILQKGIPKHLLGRVFSASLSLSGIAMPLGAMIGGMLGVMIGSLLVILISGIIVLFVGIFWMIDPTSRNLPNSENIDESTFAIRVNGYSINKEGIKMDT